MANAYPTTRELEATIEILTTEVNNLRSAASTATGQRNDLSSRIVKFESAQVLNRPAQLEKDSKVRREREQMLLKRVATLEKRNADQALEITQLKGRAGQRPQTAPNGIAIASPSEAELPEDTENSSLLPYALEDIMYCFEIRKASAKTCAAKGCGCLWPTAHCFQDGHFNWCGAHHHAVGTQRTGCPHEGKGKAIGVPCKIVFWETLKADAWNELVRYSYHTGLLGSRGVPTLDQILQTAKTEG